MFRWKSFSSLSVLSVLSVLSCQRPASVSTRDAAAGDTARSTLDEVLARWDRDEHADLLEGRRVVSEGWIRAALAPRLSISDVDPYADSYGYYWYSKTHRVAGGDVAVSFASGNGGNKIYVVPSLELVVAITSRAYGRGYGQRRSEAILLAVLASLAPAEPAAAR